LQVVHAAGAAGQFGRDEAIGGGDGGVLGEDAVDGAGTTP
jgi:hypothetical protein